LQLEKYLFEINIHWLFILWPLARSRICSVVSGTEAKSFTSLMQPSLFIFCLRPPVLFLKTMIATLPEWLPCCLLSKSHWHWVLFHTCGWVAE